MASAAAVKVAPHENDMVLEMMGFAQRMIRSVAATGSGGATPDVLEFQRAWNRNLPIIQSLLRKLGQPASAAKKLVEDGKYGPNTANSLCGIICGACPKPPQRASGMPVWMAANNSCVDGLTPPTPDPLDSVLNQSPPLPLDNTSAAQDVLNSGGSTIRDVAPVYVPGRPADAPPQVISTTTSHVPTGAPGPGVEITAAPGPDSHVDQFNQLTNEELLGLETDTEFDERESIRIKTSRPASRVPWIAVGVGTATLGGLLYWWANRRKRRR